MTAKSAITQGTLYIIATPIGNLEDISNRALKILAEVDLILAEDTRHSKQLLSSFALKKPLASLHAHNEAKKSSSFIEALIQGKSIALISDAGTPLISDPGYPLVKLARENNLKVVPIPGPCAIVCALSAAGVPCDAFSFVGFLPAKQEARRQKLSQLKKYEHSIVFYESTHRILACTDDLIDVFGEQTELVLAKELTKTFERFVSGSAFEIKRWLLANDAHRKGEFVIIIPPRPRMHSISSHEALLTLLLAELSLKQAVKIASQITGAPKNELYKTALELAN